MRFMNHANQVVGKKEELLKQQYGFVAYPTLPLWKNVKNRLMGMELREYLAGSVGNLTCHNLLRNLGLPAGTKKLLGLGLNYCLKAPSTTATTANIYSRMIEDIRRMYHLRDAGNNDEYISRLYIKSDYKFDNASDKIE